MVVQNLRYDFVEGQICASLLFSFFVKIGYNYSLQSCWIMSLWRKFTAEIGNTVCSKKSDAKIEIIITATNLIRIKYPLSSLNYHLSGANVANFNKIHCTVFEQQLFKKWSSKTEVSNMEKSPYQFVRNTTSYSLCSKWSPFAQTRVCLLCRLFVLCYCQISCLQSL